MEIYGENSLLAPRFEPATCKPRLLFVMQPFLPLWLWPSGWGPIFFNEGDTKDENMLQILLQGVQLPVLGLIQVKTVQNDIFIFRTGRNQKLFVEGRLKNLFEDQNILKVLFQHQCFGFNENFCLGGEDKRQTFGLT